MKADTIVRKSHARGVDEYHGTYFHYGESNVRDAGNDVYREPGLI